MKKKDSEVNWGFAFGVMLLVAMVFLALFLVSPRAGIAQGIGFVEECEVQVKVRGRSQKDLSHLPIEISNYNCLEDLKVSPCKGFTDENGEISFSVYRDFPGNVAYAQILLADTIELSRVRRLVCEGEVRKIAFREITPLVHGRIIRRDSARGEQMHAALLFVHGLRIDLAPGCGFNGGSRTWGAAFSVFARSGFSSYELQYPTDQSAHDIARDVVRAVRKIHRRTGMNVGIVAHSFGGIVARNAITKFPFLAQQATSLITLGTPHCGLNELCQRFICEEIEDEMDIDEIFLQKLIARPFPGDFALTFVAGKDPPVSVGECASRPFSDGVVTTNSARSFCGLSTNAATEILQGVGHGDLSAIVLPASPQAQVIFDHLQFAHCAGAEEIEWNFYDDDCDGEIDEDNGGIGEF